MKKDIIHNSIIHPEILSETGIDALVSITNQFPYFSAAQLLLTKAYQNANDHRYTDQLHQSAVYSADRKLLYDWVKKTTESPVFENAESISEAIKPETAEQDLAEKSLISNISLESPSEFSELAQLILDEDQAPIPKLDSNSTENLSSSTVVIDFEKNLIPKNDAISEVEPPLEIEEKAPAIKFTEIDSMEQEILLEAMQSSIEMEVQPVVQNRNTEDVADNSSPEFELSADDNSYAAMIFRRSKSLHFAENQESKPKSEEVPDLSTDWLRRESAQIPEYPKSPAVDTDNLTGFQNTPLSHGIQRIKVEDSRTHQKSLIDRFIQLEPNIARGKAGEYSPGNIAKDSLEEDYSFVTETMAQLFAKQGKLDKARKAFKKLIELHPEKSIYFAAQLKNLEKLKK